MKATKKKETYRYHSKREFSRISIFIMASILNILFLGSAIQEGKATFYLVLEDNLYMKDFWTYDMPDGVLELGIPNGPIKQTILDKRYFPEVLSYFQKEKSKKSHRDARFTDS